MQFIKIPIFIFVAVLYTLVALVASAAPITVKVFDVMNLTKEEFVTNGLGSGTVYTAQRGAITEGSGFLLSTVTNGVLSGAASPSPNKMPTSASATNSWRRVGQYIGGSSEAEEEEFFAEADRVLEKWLEMQQIRKGREAAEKRKQAELEKKKQDQKNKSGSKNADQREGEESENSNPKEKNSSNKNSKENENKLPLALPAATITQQDAKRRKLVLNPNATIESKIKNVAWDVKTLMKRLRAAFIPQAAENYKMAISGKSAANANRHRQLVFEQFYNGAIPHDAYNATTGEINEVRMQKAMEGAIYDMLKYYSGTTTTSTSTSSGGGNGDSSEGRHSSNASSAATPSSSSSSAITAAINPYTWYPRLHQLPIIDADELSSLAEELRHLQASEKAIEKSFGLIEKGMYEHDLGLKIASLKAQSKADAKEGRKDTKNAAATTISMIESNPREYYRALRQFSMTPKISNELATLATVLNTNYQYQQQLMHSSYPLIVTAVLPRLRKEASQLKATMRGNDESTQQLRKQLKEHNQLLKLINNDINSLSAISIRMTRFRNGIASAINGSPSGGSDIATASTAARQLLLSASDFTTLLMWTAAERRTGAATTAIVHPDDYARVMRGEQPVMDGNNEEETHTTSGDDANNKAAKRKSRRNRRNGGADSGASSDNYLEGDANGPDFAHRPITEWAQIVSYTAFGLGLHELLIIILSIVALPLIDAMVQTPLLLVKHTRWLMSSAMPKLRRWAGGNRTAGPSGFGKIVLLVCQLHLFVTSFVTNVVVKFGKFALPLIGLYFSTFMEMFLVAGLQYVRVSVLNIYASTRGQYPTYQSLSEVQSSLRHNIPFTVWVILTPLQQFALAGFIVAVAAVVMWMLLAPMYGKATRDLTALTTIRRPGAVPASSIPKFKAQ